MRNRPQDLRRIKQKGRPPLLKRGTPPVVKTRNPSVVFLWSDEKAFFRSQFLQQKARKNRHFHTKMAVFWSECNYRTWKNPVVSMVLYATSKGFLSYRIC